MMWVKIKLTVIIVSDYYMFISSLVSWQFPDKRFLMKNKCLLELSNNVIAWTMWLLYLLHLMNPFVFMDNEECRPWLQQNKSRSFSQYLLLSLYLWYKDKKRQHNECCGVCGYFARGHYIYCHSEKMFESFIIIDIFLIGLQLGLFYLSALKTADYFLKPAVENNFPSV